MAIFPVRRFLVEHASALNELFMSLEETAAQGASIGLRLSSAGKFLTIAGPIVDDLITAASENAEEGAIRAAALSDPREYEAQIVAQGVNPMQLAKWLPIVWALVTRIAQASQDGLTMAEVMQIVADALGSLVQA